MPPMGFEPTISAGERLQTYFLDRAATGTGKLYAYTTIYPKRRGDKNDFLKYRVDFPT